MGVSEKLSNNKFKHSSQRNLNAFINPLGGSRKNLKSSVRNMSEIAESESDEDVMSMDRQLKVII